MNSAIWSRFRLSSLSSVMASLAAGVYLFVVFRIAVDLTSRQAIGAWALIQGLFVAARVTDAGTSVNLLREASLTIGAKKSAQALFLAGVLLSTAPTLVVGATMLLPVEKFVGIRFAAEGAYVWELAIGAFIFSVLNSFAAAVLAVFEGSGRLVFKNFVMASSYLAALPFSYISIATWKEAGIGVAYCAVPTIQIIALGAAWSRRGVHFSRPRPSEILAQMKILWRENLRLSAIAMLKIGLEPATKLLLGLAGGLALVAIFDLAQKLTTQFRVLLQAATQPLVYFGARQGEAFAAHQGELFRKVNEVLVRAIPLTIGVQLALSVPFSFLGFGGFEITFVRMFMLMVLANALNSVGLVGYYYVISCGNSGPVLWLSVMMVVINIGFGASAVYFAMNPMLVAVAYCVAMGIGGLGLFGLLPAHLRHQRAASAWNLLLVLPIGPMLMTGALGPPMFSLVSSHILLIGAVALASVFGIALTVVFIKVMSRSE